ncbi:hypothetical protein [Cellvibrio sp. QJXJ]|uniref:hypothetical protein n=1 Tax=Cellvibrio sp. QJXJ TaxID=2964606 RepID=UPI0021C2BA77|nr:hypothetical protein [Cellvibrio sp. QJXJ]UUA71070.1 hypothetical protein NNX04_11665 [Cellvibrio sp. QJXJ]
MTQLGEGIAVTSITDPDRPHWVQVEYKYANGKPVKGSFLATDSEGMTWAGKLNDQGQACLSNLPPGSVEFELVSDDLEDELKQTRTNIKTVLDSIVAEQKAEAAKHEKELAQQNALQQAGSHYWAYTKGFWNGAVGLVTFAKDVVVKTAEVAQYLSPLERLNNLLHAGYKSYYDGTLTSAQWKQSLAKNLQDEEIKDIARILGIDAKHLSSEGLQRLKELFAEAYEITAFIADDKESLDMLTQFGKDYAGAQSSIEWAEFAGGGVFEIVLTALLLMFTGGIGNVAQGASKIRHAGKLKSLGSIFRNLGKLLKRKKLRKKISGSVDKKHTVNTDLPPGKKTSSPKTAHQKAAFGEKTAHEKMVSDGYQPLGNTNGTYKPGETGIDGVYKHPNPPPDYVITEAKYNTAKLGKLKDGTKQLDDKWVTGGKRLEKAGLSPSEQKAIAQGLKRGDGTVEKLLVRVKPDGTTVIKKIP